MEWITSHWDLLVLVVANLIGLAVVVAKLTPSTTDDEWIAKIEEMFKNVTTKK